MKNYIFILLLLLAFTSCADFLELEPENQINDKNYYLTENDFETSMLGIYASFKGLYTSEMFYIGELTSDNAEISISSSSAGEVEFDEMIITSENPIIENAWNKALYTVARCNVIINRLNTANIDQEVNDRIMGEARFIRAFCYFFLVQTFGKAPVADVEFRSPEEIYASDLSLKSKEEVYTMIEIDLKDAESLLPEAMNPDKGYVSVGTVKTLLGKVYLTQKKYDLAAPKLKEVIDSKDYSLVDDYKSLFSAGNENLSESIFELKFISGDNLGNQYSVLFTPATVGLLANNQQGSGRINPTLDLMNAYEEGERKRASVGDTIAPASEEKFYARHGLKFVDLNLENPRDGSINFTVLRYADVLLMYAEALNEQGKPEDAEEYINAVRDRVDLSPHLGLSQEDMREAIAHERRVELAFEAHRWFDLVRTARAQEEIDDYFKNKGVNFSVKDHELIMPIPQREIEINPEMKQNPGY